MSKIIKKIKFSLRKWRESGSIDGVLTCDPRHYALAIVGDLAENADESLLVLAETVAAAEYLRDEIGEWLTLLDISSNVVVLPELEGTRHAVVPERECERSRVFSMTELPGTVFVASIAAAFAPAPTPSTFRQAFLDLQVGTTDWAPHVLAEYLTGIDYDNEVEVRQPGEFSIRGGILDVFSPAHDFPIRLDFFGNELESIRTFSPDTQRSLDMLDHCLIIPRGEVAMRDLVEEEVASFPDYLDSSKTTCIVCSPLKLECHLDTYCDEDWGHRYASFNEAWCPSLTLEEPVKGVRAEAPLIADLDEVTRRIHDLNDPELRREALAEAVAFWLDRGYHVTGLFSSESKISRFRDMLGPLSDRIMTHEVSIGWGVHFPQEKLVVLSDSEVFGQAASVLRGRGSGKGALYHVDRMVETSDDLHPGGFAVHALYGICRFLGLEVREFSGEPQEVLVLEFAGDVEVHVPLEQAYLISRYSGGGKSLPKLSKIGHSRWKKVRSDAESAVTDLAAELLRMQALRATCDGHAFPGDEEAMAEFREAFPYQETPDQTVAIAEVLEDMARTRPMDRLLCGDVGFGKTEVAMRAAFRAILDGMQVAVLVPTTVLCQQHYLSFRERFREFPVIIEELSRFQKPAKQRETLLALAEGRVDIVIGTHRLLSEDLTFANLGLMVIDEEQRFGVKAKERLKRLRTDVDVLTMTATPIPRTLHLSMSGLRDMSTITTPPLERLPVQTVVTNYSNELIRESVLRELQREGQTFILHNRVKTIDDFADHVRKLVPEATIDVGHGQMDEADLEGVMLKFMGGGTDVLVCTTIIESGLDIPNANTIIIDRADRFGLAELYQLRGRVGRYHRQAYAYLLIPGGSILLDGARKRLAAIRKYTQLGAGFKLAMRDLEIRGTGNILGREQSGHVTAIGFELYCRLLREAVSRMKGRPIEQRRHVSLICDFIGFGENPSRGRVPACIPVSYVTDEAIRVGIYRRMSALSALEAVDEFAEELTDRFGELPQAVIHFMDVVRIKIHAVSRGIHSIHVRDGKAYLETSAGYVKRSGRIPLLSGATPEDKAMRLLRLLEAISGIKGK